MVLHHIFFLYLRYWYAHSGTLCDLAFLWFPHDLYHVEHTAVQSDFSSALGPPRCPFKRVFLFQSNYLPNSIFSVTQTHVSQHHSAHSLKSLPFLQLYSSLFTLHSLLQHQLLHSTLWTSKPLLWQSAQCLQTWQLANLLHPLQPLLHLPHHPQAHHW